MPRAVVRVASRVPYFVHLGLTALKYRNFDPPIKISGDELRQIDAYRRSIPALHTLGFDDPDTLAINEARR